MSLRPRAIAEFALPAALLALTLAILLVYWPGLRGPFLFDDFPNLLHNTPLRAYAARQGQLWSVLAAGHAGPAGRPLAVLSLALQGRYTGFVPFPFKLFNLLIHALNAAVLLLLSRALLRRVTVPVLSPVNPSGDAAGRVSLTARPTLALALLTAALWGLHPLNLTPVLLVVQRMTSLAALGLLLAISCSVHGHALLAQGRPAGRWLWLGFPLAGLSALLCKETAVLLPAFLLILDATLLRSLPLPTAGQDIWRRFIRWFGWLPLCMALLALPWLLPMLLHGYANRDFSVQERLLTEGRVIWFYLRLLMLPDAQALGLYHDDFVRSSDLWQPWTTLPALGGLLLLAITAVFTRRRSPWLSFAIAWLLVSQLLESTLVPLELVFEHRVYLGLWAPLLVAALAAWELLARNRVQWPCAWIGVLVVLLALATWQRARDWSDALLFASLEAAHHPASPRAQYELANLYGDLGEFETNPVERRRLLALAEQAALRAIAVAPQEAKPRVGLLVICGMAGCKPPADSGLALEQILHSDRRTELMGEDLVNLAPCIATGRCAISVSAWLRFCDALASNPALTARAAAMLADARRALARPGPGARP